MLFHALPQGVLPPTDPETMEPAILSGLCHRQKPSAQASLASFKPSGTGHRMKSLQHKTISARELGRCGDYLKPLERVGGRVWKC